MTPTREQTRTERRLAEVEELQRSLEQLAQELAAYKDALVNQLELLRQQGAASRRPPVAAASPRRPRPTLQGDPLAAATGEAVPASPPPEPRRGQDAIGPDEAAPSLGKSGLRRGLASVLAEGKPEPPATSAAAASRPPAFPPERHADHGRPSAGPLPEPRPNRKTDSGTRRGGKPVSVLISADGLGGESEPVSGWVLERTANTLRLLVDEQLAIGSVYSIRPAKEHPNAQWVQISIKSCVPERSSFTVLAQFVERPPWTALALL